MYERLNFKLGMFQNVEQILSHIKYGRSNVHFVLKLFLMLLLRRGWKKPALQHKYSFGVCSNSPSDRVMVYCGESSYEKKIMIKIVGCLGNSECGESACIGVFVKETESLSCTPAF